MLTTSSNAPRLDGNMRNSTMGVLRTALLQVVFGGLVFAQLPAPAAVEDLAPGKLSLICGTLEAAAAFVEFDNRNPNRRAALEAKLAKSEGRLVFKALVFDFGRPDHKGQTFFPLPAGPPINIALHKGLICALGPGTATPSPPVPPSPPPNDQEQIIRAVLLEECGHFTRTACSSTDLAGPASGPVPPIATPDQREKFGAKIWGHYEDAISDVDCCHAVWYSVFHYGAPARPAQRKKLREFFVKRYEELCERIAIIERSRQDLITDDPGDTVLQAWCLELKKTLEKKKTSLSACVAYLDASLVG